MEKHFQETAKAFLEKGTNLSVFHPFPPASERAAYEQLPSKLRAALIAQGEACLGYSYPPIRATDFMAFKRTGNRVNYEDIYFERRWSLNSLVTAECVEGNGRFLDDIINGIFALCEESAWQLPAHNSYLRNAPQEILPDNTRPVLDLFACETGAQLACIYYLLKEQLDAVSPFIATRILSELERRILIPYVHEHFWWMGNGEEPMCNWTPWCTQNVLLTVFLINAPQGVKKAALKKAAAGLDAFLKDYGEDGCCDEGVHYFRHAGLCVDTATDLMNQVTNGAFSHLYQWEKMQHIAMYIANVHVEGKYYFNFSDSSAVEGRAGVREYLFGKHTSQPALMLFAAKNFQEANDDIYTDESYRLNLFYRLQNTFTYTEVMEYDTSVTIVQKDIYYPSIGLFLSRSNTFCLAVKAGDNDDNHNHNDTGSFILYKNGTPIFVDIGVESYCAKTFSALRYEIWTMQSGYHNLPTINGLDEHDGADYHACDVSTRFAKEKASISMELAEAYPLAEGTDSYIRSVVFDKTENLITLTDTTDSKDVILNFITFHKPECKENSLQIGNANAEFNGASLLCIETLPITDRLLKGAWNHDLYRIRLKMTGAEFQLTIK